VAKAVWNGSVIAESAETRQLEGNTYFPSSSLRAELFSDSKSTTTCSWKGTAHYFNVVVGGEVNPDAAWYYPTTKVAAERIEGYVAFWRGVTIEP
jgi:uncharacterized protein (DUF427 family)